MFSGNKACPRVSKRQQKQVSDDLLLSKSKVKKAVNDSVPTVAHLIPLQITFAHLIPFQTT